MCLGKVEIPALSASFLGQESSLHHLNLGVRSPKTFFIRMRGLGLQVLQSGRTNYDKCVGGGGTSGVVRLARCTHTHTHTRRCTDTDTHRHTHTRRCTDTDTHRHTHRARHKLIAHSLVVAVAVAALQTLGTRCRSLTFVWTRMQSLLSLPSPHTLQATTTCRSRMSTTKAPTALSTFQERRAPSLAKSVSRLLQLESWGSTWPCPLWDTRTYTHAHTHTYTHIHTCTHAHMHTYTHTRRTCLCLCLQASHRTRACLQTTAQRKARFQQAPSRFPSPSWFV